MAVRHVTCPECGTQFDTSHPRKLACSETCQVTAQRRRAKIRLRDEGIRQRTRELANLRRARNVEAIRKYQVEQQWWQRKTKAVNDDLRGRAHRHGKEWTGPELELALRPDLSARAVAEILGRTLSAVSYARRKAKSEPREIALAGVASSRQ